MICVDKSIMQFIQNASKDNCQDTCIFDGVNECVTCIGYDLRTKQFQHPKNRITTEWTLDPGEAIIVASEEIIYFGKNVAGRVCLKNSRIRQGLSLDAPIYQPGHKTRIYFRLMNISDNRIILKAGEQYAMLVFEKLECEPEKPYTGTYQEEYDYKDMADYSANYKDQIESIGGKLQKAEELEHRLYGNVSVLLSVFIAIFTLLNINVQLAKEAAGAANFILFNAGTLCAISFLMALINEMLQKNDKTKSHGIWWAPILCAAVAAIGYWLL